MVRYFFKIWYFSCFLFLAGNIGFGMRASASSFLTSNLAGTWDYHMLVSGDSPQWTGWIYGSWNVGTNGVASWTSITRSDGDSALPPDSQIAVSSTGVIMAPGTDFHGVINAGKDMIVGTMTDGGGGYSLHIYSKRFEASYETSDLAGTWNSHMLLSGDSPQWMGWTYGSWNVGTNGVASWTSITRSDGDSALPPDSQMAVSSTGVITAPGTNFHGVMNTGKDMIVGTMTDGGGGYNLLMFIKHQRMNSFIPQMLLLLLGH